MPSRAELNGHCAKANIVREVSLHVSNYGARLPSVFGSGVSVSAMMINDPLVSRSAEAEKTPKMGILFGYLSTLLNGHFELTLSAGRSYHRIPFAAAEGVH